jgi:uncharacterized protein (DUF697 family)
MSTLGLRSLLGVAREARAGAAESRPLVLGGARELAALLAKELRAGGDAAAVVEHGSVEGAAALVWIGRPDEGVLRRAAQAKVPIVGVSDGSRLPYVLDTDLVVLPPGQGLPVEEIARALARALGDRRVGLAARLPVLRASVVEELVESCARRNGLIAAAVFVPGADLPILTLNELRMVIGVALANGGEVGLARVPELLGVLGAGLGSRRLARGLCAFAPAAGFALRGAVAYAATRAIGEAASARFGSGLGLSVRPGT